MESIPFVTQENHIEGDELYEKFYHTVSYISKKSLEFDRNSTETDFQNLMELCGYNKKQKFQIHRKQWNLLERKVPRKYLEGIGIQMRTLDFTLELDKNEYKRMLEIPYNPTFVTVKIMPGIYQSLTLPDEITEEEAIEIMQIYAKDHNIRCFINLPEIKTVEIDQDGKVDIRYFEPKILEDQNWFYPPEYQEIL
ncbi:MAG: hypothetical protein OEZ34_14655 [Spirochaetia bacterium]|nr:hypothetical protein [Spirochaetia bacterium]